MALNASTSDRPGAVIPTTSSVSSSASSVTIAAANPSRQGFSVANTSTAILYLSFSTPATTANAFAVIAANSNYTSPFPVRGAIYGIWASANGTAQITEYV